MFLLLVVLLLLPLLLLVFVATAVYCIVLVGADVNAESDEATHFRAGFGDGPAANSLHSYITQSPQKQFR